MIQQAAYRALGLVFWVVVAAAIVWPTLALTARCANESAPVAELWPSFRQLTLLAKSAGLAAGAAALAVGASIPAAAALYRQGATGGILPWACGCILLCPPMVYAFGWQRILSAGVDPRLTCVLVWASWGWPVSAFFLAHAWRARRDVFDAGVLAAGPARAAAFILLPTAIPAFLAAASALFLLFFTDYAVPHAFGLIVYATETLGWAANSTRVADVVWPALPGLIVVFAAVLAFVATVRRASPLEPLGNPALPGRLPVFASSAVLIFCAVPLVALTVRLGSLSPLAEAVRTYSVDIAFSVFTAALAGILVAVLAVGTAAAGKCRAPVLIASVILGAVPGALVGKALIVAYNRDATGWVYDHWPIVTLAYTARFGWIGAVGGMLMARSFRTDAAAAAATDGASTPQVLLCVILPQYVPLLLALTGIVSALALAEITATALVRVPTFAPLSAVIIEKFHRLEDEMLISLSLMLVGASLAGAWLWRWAMGRRAYQ